MPPFFLFTSDDDVVAQRRAEAEAGASGRATSPSAGGEPHKQNMWGRLHKIGSWLKKDGEDRDRRGSMDRQTSQGTGREEQLDSDSRSGLIGRRPSKRVVPGLPRPITFRRQESERRDRLMPHEPCPHERRAVSADRKGNAAVPRRRTRSSPPASTLSMSVPDIRELMREECPDAIEDGEDDMPILPTKKESNWLDDDPGDLPPIPPQPLSLNDDFSDRGSLSDGIDDHLLQEELEKRWILNLSMHFRDRSDREKFWITFAERDDHWRRVTVSCDYRGVPEDSLEANLKSLHFQRDKSACIYEAIRDSLTQVVFYNTVTNLKLQTSDGRLHVHVTEDVNEIIPYPPTAAVAHLDCPRFRESDVLFDSHLSGFVYKVKVHGQYYIKKEIPGPDQVEEFLYEINALCGLQGSQSVIEFRGLVVDDDEKLVKGVLISYAKKGTLVDLLYDDKHVHNRDIPWKRRERWAKQVVQGLSEIHEGGFVQGDFTLSNIVVDENDDAKIIDINRRGCPVGWEPPELSRLIESGQRISIYIGVKSDLFQLGMVLWALAEQEDEPERQERPLRFTRASDGVPDYFRGMVAACLSDSPRNRASALDLLRRFPEISEEDSRPTAESLQVLSPLHRPHKEYIDPHAAIRLEDIDRFHRRRPRGHSDLSTGEVTYPERAASSEYVYYSSGSYVVGQRSVSRRRGRQARDHSPPYTHASSAPSLGDCPIDPDPEPLSVEAEPAWEQISVYGNTHLVDRTSLDIESVDETITGPTETCVPVPQDEAGRSSETVKKNGVDEPKEDFSAWTAERVLVVEDEAERPPNTVNMNDREGARIDAPDSTVAPSRRRDVSPDRGRSWQPSFHERMLELGTSSNGTLLGLGDIAHDPLLLKSDEPTPDFTAPLHQDSGFDETMTAPVRSSTERREDDFKSQSARADTAPSALSTAVPAEANSSSSVLTYPPLPISYPIVPPPGSPSFDTSCTRGISPHHRERAPERPSAPVYPSSPPGRRASWEKAIDDAG